MFQFIIFIMRPHEKYNKKETKLIKRRQIELSKKKFNQVLCIWFLSHDTSHQNKEKIWKGGRSRKITRSHVKLCKLVPSTRSKALICPINNYLKYPKKEEETPRHYLFSSAWEFQQQLTMPVPWYKNIQLLLFPWSYFAIKFNFFMTRLWSLACWELPIKIAFKNWVWH